jgi:tetratricopeptide (TPR) repeat protein
MSCLDRRRSELAALVDELGRDASVDTAARSVEAALRLTKVSTCADGAALAMRVPLPDDLNLRASAMAMQGQLDRVEALYDTGKGHRAIAAWGVVKAAAIHPYAPLRARALLLDGVIGALSGAVVTPVIEAGVRAAVAARDDTQVATAWLELIGNHVDTGKYQQAADLALTVDMAIARAGDDPEQRAELERALGMAYRYLGRMEDAKLHAERAVALLRGLPGPPPMLDATLASAARTYAESGDGESARRFAEEGVATAQRIYGPRNWKVASALGGLGHAYTTLHRSADAVQLYRRALALYEEDLGPDSRFAAIARLNVAGSELQDGQLEAARADFERAVAALEKVLGPRHPAVAEALGGLGETLSRLGRDVPACATLDRALSIASAKFGAEHPRVAKIRVVRADVDLHAGRAAAALAGYEAATRIRAKFPDDDADQATAELVGAGRSLLALRRVAEAVAVLEKADKIAPPGMRDEVAQELARARGGSRP